MNYNPRVRREIVEDWYEILHAAIPVSYQHHQTYQINEPDD